MAEVLLERDPWQPEKRLYLALVGVVDIGDRLAWDFDCLGGERGPHVNSLPTKVLTAKRQSKDTAESLTRCNRNHLGCRLSRWWRQDQKLHEVVKLPELFMDVTDDDGWTRRNNHRRHLARTGIKVEYAWIKYRNGLRLVVAEADLTPWGMRPMRRVPRETAFERLGTWYVKVNTVERQFSKGWVVKPDARLGAARADRLGRARVETGLDGRRLPEGMSVEEAREVVEMELFRQRMREKRGIR